MAALKYSSILLLLVTSCALAEDPRKVNIENHLFKCVKLTKTERIVDSGAPFLNIEYSLISSTGDCGCKSAVNSFNSYAVVDDTQTHLLGGKFIFLETNNIKLPIAAQDQVIGNDAKIKLVFSCAQPD